MKDVSPHHHCPNSCCLPLADDRFFFRVRNGLNRMVLARKHALTASSKENDNSVASSLLQALRVRLWRSDRLADAREDFLDVGVTSGILLTSLSN
jgi:hypothetical protein